MLRALTCGRVLSRVPGILNLTVSPHFPPPSTNITYQVYTMETTDLEARCNALRHDLKAWEKKFAAQNNGRKAGRDDIKANATICMHASNTTTLRSATNTL